MIAWTSSGSSFSEIAVNPDTSQNITVTIFRSPSIAPLDVRIFSARCRGVYASGDPKRAAVAAGAAAGVRATAGLGADATAGAARRWPHSPQNLLAGGLTAWQAGHRAWSRAPHSPQNFAPDGLARRH